LKKYEKPEYLCCGLVSKTHTWTLTEQTFIQKCWFFTGIYLLFIATGAVSYFAITIGIKQSPSTFQEYLRTSCQVYVIDEACDWPGAGAIVVILGHFMEVAWAYGDMLVFLFSYSLKYEYDRFNAILAHKRDTRSRLRLEEIECLRILHWKTVQAIQMTDKILGQITTTSFAFNIIYLFCRVFIGLEEDLSTGHPLLYFEAVFDFVYLTGRIFLSAIMAARLDAVKVETVSVLMEILLQQHGDTHMLLVNDDKSLLFTVFRFSIFLLNSG
jgi:hypothetical protein